MHRRPGKGGTREREAHSVLLFLPLEGQSRATRRVTCSSELMHGSPLGLKGTKRATSVNVQLLRLQRDLRTGSVSRDICESPLRALQPQKWHVYRSGTFGAAWVQSVARDSPNGSPWQVERTPGQGTFVGAKLTMVVSGYNAVCVLKNETGAKTFSPYSAWAKMAPLGSELLRWEAPGLPLRGAQ